VALDLRDPILDRVGHEAAHAASLRWYGYTARVVTFDLRWGDFGHFGAFDGVRRASGDPARESRDRSVIAAIGPLLGGVSLDHPSARADRRAIDLNITDGWSAESWRWLSFERARDLARHEPFRAVWRAFVVHLHDLGEEYVELCGDDVDAFLESVPGAGLLPGAPRPSAATSAGVPGT
jgi:hypothetical protein